MGSVVSKIGGLVDGALGGGTETIAGVNPFSVTTATGTGAFDAATGQATSTLSPEMQALFNQQTQAAAGAFGNVAGAGQQAQDLSSGFLSQAATFDPFAAAEEQFNRLDAILEQGRTSARSGTAAGLLQTGRLGGTSGNEVQANVEAQIENQRQALLAEQFQGAQAVQSNLVQQGTNLGAFGLQQQMGQQGIGTQSLQNALGIDAQQQAALSTGSGLTKTQPIQGEQGAFSSILQGGLTAGIGSLVGMI